MKVKYKNWTVTDFRSSQTTAVQSKRLELNVKSKCVMFSVCLTVNENTTLGKGSTFAILSLVKGSIICRLVTFMFESLIRQTQFIFTEKIHRGKTPDTKSLSCARLIGDFSHFIIIFKQKKK